MERLRPGIKPCPADTEGKCSDLALRPYPRAPPPHLTSLLSHDHTCDVVAMAVAGADTKHGTRRGDYTWVLALSQNEPCREGGPARSRFRQAVDWQEPRVLWVLELSAVQRA
ncbi:hypothetical protein GCM10009863_27440 [Streptomyces axinellae]|uniref:Uncharacterized protein n=1 Tax=Streptomyces axinellae TaxID=552788 RepID=A0ABN3Q2C5_9ACTN